MVKNYSAIICEGSAEQAIIEILLENNCIIVEKDEYLINNGPIRIRSAKNFCDTYLGKSFGSKIDLYRIIDSKNERFNFGSAKYKKIFEEKLNVVNIITPPEIELLIIVSKDMYRDFERSQFSKPSDYCKQKLKYRDVKTYEFVKNHFSELNILLEAIKEVHRIKHSAIPSGFNTLYNILKDEFK